MKAIDADTIIDITRTLIGETEPYGDSAIDRERTKNVDKLISVIAQLLFHLERVAINKDRYEGSMREMGKKAYKAAIEMRDYLDGIIEEGDGDEINED